MAWSRRAGQSRRGDADRHVGFDSDVPGDDFLDDFPLGDGTADMSGTVHCPYCGESNTIALDPGSGTHQQYTEDCQVCCQPWTVFVTYHADGSAEISVEAADEP